MKKDELLNQALALTSENIVKKSVLKSINHRLVEVLRGQGSKSRLQIINEITYLRVSETVKVTTELLQEASKADTEFRKLWMATSRTVKNGVDTSLANGHTNSNFSFNPEFSKFTINKDRDNKYFITEV